MDVVLVAQLELDVAAQGVDLVHSDLGAVLGRNAVDGSIAGQGAGAADLEGSAGGGAGGALTAGVGLGGAGVIPGTAGAQAQGHDGGQSQAQDFLVHV